MKVLKYGKKKNIGTYPVIFISFAAVKGDTFEITKQQIVTQIVHLFEEKRFLLDADVMSESEKIKYKQFVLEPEKFDISAKLNELSNYLSRYYNKKVIILLDEYDTPMQEAYVYGFWKDIVSFMRSLFNATFKTNPYLERAVMTGITRVSKESIFSDLNNLKVRHEPEGLFLILVFLLLVSLLLLSSQSLLYLPPFPVSENSLRFSLQMNAA